MQLNPARGRKLGRHKALNSTRRLKVYAAQPREGTETTHLFSFLARKVCQVYAAQPREGTETYALLYEHAQLADTRFMQLNPARGRKH